MSEMVDRAAKASFEAFAVDGETWDDLSLEWKEVYRKEARAAIKAMREPTEAMVNAVDPLDAAEGVIGNIWEAMIDEALK